MNTDDNSIINFYITCEEINNQYMRSYQTILQVFSSIGGYIQILFIIFQSITNYFSKKSFIQEIYNNLIINNNTLNDNKIKDIKTEIKDKNEINRSKSSNKFSINQLNPIINETNKKKDIITNLNNYKLDLRNNN